MPFEGLRERLLKAGIAPRHVRRYLRELTDHLEDLVTDQREAGQDADTALSRAYALLGQEDELAGAMLARPELKSWAARVPWAIFGLAPPVSMMAAFFVAGLPLILIARLDGMMGNGGMTAPSWFQTLAEAVALLANLVIGPGLAASLMTVAQRQRLNWKWPVLATLLLAGAGFHMVARFGPPHGGQIAIAWLGEFAPRFTPLLPRQSAMLGWTQFLLTLAPLLWLLRPVARPGTAR